MTTDLNKILARHDYVKLTKSLREKCDYVEGAISDKMVELELDGSDNGIAVNSMRFYCVKGYLFIRTPEEECNHGIEYRQVSSNENDIPNIFSNEADRAFRFYPCSNKHALRFLNNAAAIIERLGEIEQEKVDAINKAIEATKDL